MKRYEFKVVVDLFDTSDPQKVATYIESMASEQQEFFFPTSQGTESLVSVEYQEVPIP